MTPNELYKKTLHELEENRKVEEEELGVNLAPAVSNVVAGPKLRKVQITTMNRLRGFLAKTFGPMGSNTKIIKGDKIASINSEYSKDGLKVLKNIQFADPIEASITEELIEITRKVEKEVGDGTTSAVILSSYIFERLNDLMEESNIPPYKLISLFNKAVKDIQTEIDKRKNKCTVDDIYDIAMISTNGNEEVAENIKNIYDEYGMDVDLSVGISNADYSIVKSYDGLVIDEGFSDPAYINNREDNTCEIRNAHVYYFEDPVDTFDMIAYFNAIIQHNIIEPIQDETEEMEVIPTVICTKRISKDAETILKHLASMMYQYDTANATAQKPPILIITNVVASDEIIMQDIADLCGCKSIKKYIDPKQMQKEQEEGVAPTLENVHEFFGLAEAVVSDSKKSKFINPQHMHIDEDGEVKDSPIYTSMVEFLEQELKSKEAEGNADYKGGVRRRLAALKSNIVEYLVGGITIADREAIKDLVEDAIKNCKSSSENGWGMAANTEGLLASYTLAEEYNHRLLTGSESEEELQEYTMLKKIFNIIYTAYYDTLTDLYSTVSSEPRQFVDETINQKKPFNIKNGWIGDDPKTIQIDFSVKCSIRLDIEILNTIAKIISLMVTCNQCLIQATQLNKY